ncbi:MAG: CRISPR-associated endonuclease Cas3'' [Bryobacterales bacterium]|nr:CRISPR-associated endonuclease Cas3'' [Bryobacterales bacterium]
MFLAHRRKEDGAEQSIADHLRGVSYWAGRHASKLGLREAGELIGLLHDLGKYSNAFQCYLKSAEGLLDPDADGYTDFVSVKGKIDHSTTGAQYIWKRLSSGRAGMGVRHRSEAFSGSFFLTTMSVRSDTLG